MIQSADFSAAVRAVAITADTPISSFSSGPQSKSKEFKSPSISSFTPNTSVVTHPHAAARPRPRPRPAYRRADASTDDTTSSIIISPSLGLPRPQVNQPSSSKVQLEEIDSMSISSLVRTHIQSRSCAGSLHASDRGRRSPAVKPISKAAFPEIIELTSDESDDDLRLRPVHKESKPTSNAKPPTSESTVAILVSSPRADPVSSSRRSSSPSAKRKRNTDDAPLPFFAASVSEIAGPISDSDRQLTRASKKSKNSKFRSGMVAADESVSSSKQAPAKSPKSANEHATKESRTSSEKLKPSKRAEIKARSVISTSEKAIYKSREFIEDSDDEAVASATVSDPKPQANQDGPERFVPHDEDPRESKTHKKKGRKGGKDSNKGRGQKTKKPANADACAHSDDEEHHAGPVKLTRQRTVQKGRVILDSDDESNKVLDRRSEAVAASEEGKEEGSKEGGKSAPCNEQTEVTQESAPGNQVVPHIKVPYRHYIDWKTT
jgi:hypothetical protein